MISEHLNADCRAVPKPAPVFLWGVDLGTTCLLSCREPTVRLLTVVLLRPTLVQPLQRLLNRLQNSKQPSCFATSTTTRMSSCKSTLTIRLVMHQKVKVSADKPTLPSDGLHAPSVSIATAASCLAPSARMCCCSVHCQICSIDTPSYVCVWGCVCVHVSDVVFFLGKRAFAIATQTMSTFWLMAKLCYLMQASHSAVTSMTNCCCCGNG